MTVTPAEVRRWMYRYLQAHTGSFDSPAWKVEGDTHIPRLVDALARLADHVGALDDSDPRFASLAEALNEAHQQPADLDGYLYTHVTTTYAIAGASPEPDDFISDYVPVAVGIIRANPKRRRS